MCQLVNTAVTLALWKAVSQAVTCRQQTGRECAYECERVLSVCERERDRGSERVKHIAHFVGEL